MYGSKTENIMRQMKPEAATYEESDVDTELVPKDDPRVRYLN